MFKLRECRTPLNTLEKIEVFDLLIDGHVQYFDENDVFDCQLTSSIARVMRLVVRE